MGGGKAEVGWVLGSWIQDEPAFKPRVHEWSIHAGLPDKKLRPVPVPLYAPHQPRVLYLNAGSSGA
jgi:hypothetical protein